MSTRTRPGRSDPRLDRSRTAILDAAVELLSEGGVGAVTIEAVTARSGVARSTLYRHFRTNTELLAAAFQELLPTPAPPEGGTPAERLLRLVLDLAEQIERTPTVVALAWMSAFGLSAHEEGAELKALRSHVIGGYRGPFDAVLAECLPERARSGERAIDDAAAQLVGPLLFHALVTKRPSDAGFCARVVEDFLSRHT